MKLSEIKTLIKDGESETLEFKSSTASLTSGMQTVCAFLNSKHGGTLIFGIKDDGKIVGQEISDKTRKEIATELNKIEPHPQITVSYRSVQESRQIIVLQVPGDNDKAPYNYDGRAFIRNQSTTIRMLKDEYIYLHNYNNQPLWESLTNNNVTLQDLDEKRIKEFVQMAVHAKRLPLSALSDTIPDLLTKLKLLVNDKITNAGALLFCKNEDKMFLQSRVQLARFKGLDKKEFLDTKQFTGNLFDMYDKIMDYLAFILPVAARIEAGNPLRIETPAIPYKVLREAVTNALIHRDYSFAGGSFTVAIYDNRVNITNYGSLSKGVSIDQLSIEHASIQRNPLIANVFYLCNQIEKWGRGTLDMIQDCKKVGNPIPMYQEVGGGFSITFPLQEFIGTTRNRIDISGLTKRQQEIITILQNQPLNRQEIMSKLNIKIPDRTLQLELTTLKIMGLIESSGNARAIIWSLNPEI